LFATTVRKVTAQGLTLTLTDTVGFVRNLPHQLIEAFRSTLDEVTRADLALHVVDASAPDAQSQITTVRGVLQDIGADRVPEVLVLTRPMWRRRRRLLHCSGCSRTGCKCRR
jgi:GTP-binding protein HflX